MDPLRTPPAVAAFLAVLQESSADAATQTVLRQSLRVWVPSYHYLRTTLGGHHPLSVEMTKHSSRVAQTTLALAWAMLNGLADTFRCLLHLPWTRFEVSHTHLIATFPPLCATYRLAGDTDVLYARMRALHTRLSAYHHASRSPLGTMIISPESLYEVVTELDQYIIVMLNFFARNLQPSVPCPDMVMHNARALRAIPQDGRQRHGMLGGLLLPADVVTRGGQRHARG